MASTAAQLGCMTVWLRLRMFMLLTCHVYFTCQLNIGRHVLKGLFIQHGTHLTPRFNDFIAVDILLYDK